MPCSTIVLVLSLKTGGIKNQKTYYLTKSFRHIKTLEWNEETFSSTDKQVITFTLSEKMLVHFGGPTGTSQKLSWASCTMCLQPSLCLVIIIMIN